MNKTAEECSSGARAKVVDLPPDQVISVQRLINHALAPHAAMPAHATELDETPDVRDEQSLTTVESKRSVGNKEQQGESITRQKRLTKEPNHEAADDTGASKSKGKESNTQRNQSSVAAAKASTTTRNTRASAQRASEKSQDQNPEKQCSISPSKEDNDRETEPTRRPKRPASPQNDTTKNGDLNPVQGEDDERAVKRSRRNKLRDNLDDGSDDMEVDIEGELPEDEALDEEDGELDDIPEHILEEINNFEQGFNGLQGRYKLMDKIGEGEHVAENSFHTTKQCMDIFF